jgi:hypothetical protein
MESEKMSFKGRAMWWVKTHMIDNILRAACPLVQYQIQRGLYVGWWGSATSLSQMLQAELPCSTEGSPGMCRRGQA